MREFFENHFPVSIRWSHRATLNFELSSSYNDNVAWKSIWLTDHRIKLYAYWLQFECGLMKVLKLSLLEVWGKGVRYESLSISTVW